MLENASKDDMVVFGDVGHKLADSAAEFFSIALTDLAHECGSPIEKRMLAAMVDQCAWYVGALEIGAPSGTLYVEVSSSYFSWRKGDPRSRKERLEPGRHRMVIEIQQQIEQYRVDFIVSMIDGGEQRPIRSLIVECDGHDFHEKTKEQAKKDKSRDRRMKLAKLEVFRYTGSEIWKSAEACSREVMEFIDSGFGEAGTFAEMFPEL